MRKVLNKENALLLQTDRLGDDVFYAVDLPDDIDIPDRYFELAAAVRRLTLRLGDLQYSITDIPSPDQLVVINEAYGLLDKELQPLFKTTTRKTTGSKK